MNDVEMWVEGPMHPDLFGGETPIMIKMTGPMFYLVTEECTLTQN